ncbi:MAG: hypothetical protein M3464_01475 [Chloroflexota bacterium]|nr:hypothetical protein [Chloroflexota bacterium]
MVNSATPAPSSGVAPAAPLLPPKQRSPNYPAINLAEAIARLKKIYEKQRRYPTTREVLVQLMGYKSLNGASATVVSALSKYGLLEGQGDQLRVSEMGENLALHRRGDPEYAAALQTAALLPSFFRELRDQYPGGLPSEHSLRAALTRRGFTSKAIDSAVRAYRDTIEFVDAELGSSVAEPPGQSTPGVAMQAHQQPATNPPSDPTAPVPPPGQRAVVIPVAVNEWATLHASFPMTEGAWAQMLAVLTAMKPALVAPADRPDPSTRDAVSADSAGNDDGGTDGG